MRISDPMSLFFFFLMIRRPPRSTLDRSSAASDVYKRQVYNSQHDINENDFASRDKVELDEVVIEDYVFVGPVSYTHLRAHETVLDLVCRLLLEKKTNKTKNKL